MSVYGYLPPGQRAGRVRRQTEKATRFLASARLLLREQDWESAVSRAYYAVFHRVLAQAVAQGEDPYRYYSHDEVADFAGALIADKIVVRAPNGITLSHTPKAAYISLKGYREKADYHVGQTGRDDAEIACELAGNFFAGLERV